MKLLIDIGNSRLKWQLGSSNGALQLGAALDYAEQHWQQLALKSVWIASVGFEQATLKLAQRLQSFGFEVELVASKSKFAGLKIAYQQPQTFGVDRWLALLAAVHHYSGAAVVVSAGTALTIDVLDNKGAHLGGLICPGLDLMRHSLKQHTALLPLVTEDSHQLGDNTRAAIGAGTLLACAYLVAGVFEQQQQQFANLKLLLSGGNAEQIQQQLATALKQKATVDENLVFKGLSICAEHRR